MYLEEEMMQQSMSKEEFNQAVYISQRLDYLLTEQQKMSDRLSALESGDRNPLEGWEGLDQIKREHSRVLRENIRLEQEVKQLRSRLTMMQAGYNAIATIQARLDANEREMGGHRCSTG